MTDMSPEKIRNFHKEWAESWSLQTLAELLDKQVYAISCLQYYDQAPVCGFSLEHVRDAVNCVKMQSLKVKPLETWMVDWTVAIDCFWPPPDLDKPTKCLIRSVSVGGWYKGKLTAPEKHKWLFNQTDNREKVIAELSHRLESCLDLYDGDPEAFQIAIDAQAKPVIDRLVKEMGMPPYLVPRLEVRWAPLFKRPLCIFFTGFGSLDLH